MDLLERIKEHLGSNTGQTASQIAKKLGVTRKEINSLLYKHNKKVFTRIDHGEKAPTWALFNSNVKFDSHTSFEKLPPTQFNPGKQVLKQIIDQIGIQLSEKDRFSAKSGGLKFEVVLVSEGSNSNYCRFEILDVEDLIIIVNEDSYMSESFADVSDQGVAIHILHSIADCLTEYKMRRTAVKEDQFITIKNDFFKVLLATSIFGN